MMFTQRPADAREARGSTFQGLPLHFISTLPATIDSGSVIFNCQLGFSCNIALGLMGQYNNMNNQDKKYNIFSQFTKFNFSKAGTNFLDKSGRLRVLSM